MVTASVIDGDIAYVRLLGFSATAGRDVLAAVQATNLGTRLRGLVLDIRGNGGGDPHGVAQLASAFVHDKTLSTTIDAAGNRTDLRTDDTVPLLNKPLAVLVDGSSVSAADMMAAIVHDLHLGRLIGERSAGVVAGNEKAFVLGDGSNLGIDVAFSRGPNGEIVDWVDVGVDEAAPLPTAAQLAAGKDPAVERAVRGLKSR